MSDQTRRTVLRAVAIGIHWLGLTIALGSLVMRSEQSLSQMISPFTGSAPVFIGAVIAGILLGLTLDSVKALGPLVILMCLGSASFAAIIFYAPVFDGLMLRTTYLDNYVMQRVFLMTVLIAMAAVPGAIIGSWLGSSMRVHHEIAPHPEDSEQNRVRSWWERRYEADAGDRPV